MAVLVPVERRWRPTWPCVPHDILRSVRRGAGDPSYRVDPDGTVWRAIVTPEGPATLRVRPRSALAEIHLTSWGPGTAWALQQAPAMLGADDDVATFAPAHAVVAAAWSRNPHWRVPRTGLVLEALVPAVIEQKVTGQEAWTGWRRLLQRYGEPAPGIGAQGEMRCMPTADVLATISSWEWLRCHIDGARSRTIVRAARVAASLERTTVQPGDEVERRLRSLPGVGEWTAAEVRQRAHGDADAVSFGDYHVANHIGWALAGADMTDEELAVRLEPERPHRYRVQHIVTTRLPGKPRRSHRMAPRRHLPR